MPNLHAGTVNVFSLLPAVFRLDIALEINKFYINVFVCMYVCMYHVCMHVYVYDVCMYVCSMYVCVYVCK